MSHTQNIELTKLLTTGEYQEEDSWIWWLKWIQKSGFFHSLAQLDCSGRPANPGSTCFMAFQLSNASREDEPFLLAPVEMPWGRFGLAWL